MILKISRCVLVTAALVLAAAMLVGCAAVPMTAVQSDVPVQSGEKPQDAPAPTLAQQEFILPWYRGEGFNPYVSDNSLTLQLADLLFEKMVVISPDAALEYHVVTGVTRQDGRLLLTVSPNYRFDDGSPITARDVAASLQAARTSVLYGGRFADVDKIEVSAEDQVSVTLKRPDRLFAWLLDLPVLPADEVSAACPRASARYTYGEEESELVLNPHSRYTSPFPTIHLQEMTGADALANSLNIGAISLYASEKEGLANGINSSRQVGFYTNTLVFLGFNTRAWRTYEVTGEDGVKAYKTEPTGSSPLLAKSAARQAVSLLLDRAQLLETVYYNQGHTATGFFNTLGATGGQGALTQQADPAAAADLLEKLGCRKKMDGYYHWAQLLPEPDAAAPAADTPEPDADLVTLRLLVNGESSYKRYLAQQIAEALETAGLHTTLIECDSKEIYLQKVASLDFDLYIGEIKLYNNMSLDAFLKADGAAACGIVQTERMQQLYEGWRAGTVSEKTLEDALTEEMLWAPLLWRSGTLYYDKIFTGFTPSADSLFYGLEHLQLSGRE